MFSKIQVKEQKQLEILIAPWYLTGTLDSQNFTARNNNKAQLLHEKENMLRPREVIQFIEALRSAFNCNAGIQTTILPLLY